MKNKPSALKNILPTVFIIEDDPIVCDSLCYLLDSVSLNTEVFPDAQTFLKAYNPESYGCLLIDIRLPEMSGLKLQEKLIEQKNTLPIIIMTGYSDVPSTVRAMKLGAKDFILKPFNNELLLDKIQELLAENLEKQPIYLKFISLLKKLTAREREVMDLVVEGFPNKRIAKQLNISLSTVEQHRAHLMHKMEIKSAVDLVRNYMLTKEIFTIKI